MNFKALTEEQRREYAELLFAPLESGTDIKDWARSFLDLELPLEITDPDSINDVCDTVSNLVTNLYQTSNKTANPWTSIVSRGFLFNTFNPGVCRV